MYNAHSTTILTRIKEINIVNKPIIITIRQQDPFSHYALSLTGMVVDRSPSPTSSVASPSASPPSLSLIRFDILCSIRYLHCCCVFFAVWLWSLPSVLCLSWQLKQFKADNSDVGFGSGTMAVDQAIEKTIANIKWIEQNKETVLQWFEDAVKQWGFALAPYSPVILFKVVLSWKQIVCLTDVVLFIYF